MNQDTARELTISFDSLIQAEEFHRAVSNTPKVTLLEKDGIYCQIESDNDGFDSLIKQLSEQEESDKEYEQYDFEQANTNALTIFKSQLHSSNEH